MMVVTYDSIEIFERERLPNKIELATHSHTSNAWLAMFCALLYSS